MKRVFWIGFLLFLVQFLVMSCNREVTGRSCSIESLLIDTATFPSNPKPGDITPLSTEPRTSAAQSYYFDGDFAYQEIIQYQREKRAIERFQQRLPGVLKVTDGVGPWETSQEITFTSEGADELIVVDPKN